MAISQLGYLGLSVGKLEEWEKLATRVLGLEVGRRGDDGSLFLRMDEYDWRIALHPGAADDVAYLGWEVPDEEALAEAVDRLKQHGATVRDGDAAKLEARGVCGLVDVVDPAGVAHEIYYGPRVRFEQPFRPSRAHSGFLTGSLGIGHAVLVIPDAEAGLRFYRDALGFRISDYIFLRPAPNFELKLHFMHANPRHHSLAFAQAPLPKRLNHFMLQVRELDDVGKALDLCAEHGVPIAQTLGRHTNDHMVSFYLRTPSGFEIEYGWGAREVDDTSWQVVTHESGSSWGHRRQT